MNRLVLIIMILVGGCKSSENAPKADLAPAPIEATPEPTTSPVPTPEATPEPTASPLPTASPSPSPSPSPAPIEACRDPSYPLVGTWQNIAKPEDELTFNADCTYTSTACHLLPRPWTVLFTNEERTGGSVDFDVQNAEALSYCGPVVGPHVDIRHGGWSNLSQPVGRMQISIHYGIAQDIYERVD